MDYEKLIEQAIAKAQELIGIEQSEMAREISQQVLRCDPDNIDAIEIIGLTYHQERRYDLAIKYLRKAYEAKPDCPDFINNLALPLSTTGKFDEAIELLRSIVEKHPSNPKFRSNLAIQYRSQGKINEAIKELKESLKHQELATTLNNLGGTYGENHQLTEAEDCFRRAIELEPENAMAHTDLAYSLHLQGKYEEGWKEYEWRFKSFPHLQPYNQKYDPKLKWNGTDDLNDKRIAIYCEQGLGDIIQFIRFIKNLKREYPEAYVILHCPESLVSLFKNSKIEIDEYFTIPILEMTWVLAHDYHCSLISLPYLLKIEDFSEINPYLYSEKVDVGYQGHFKIGICWAGSPLHPNDRIRSCHLKLFKDVHDMPHVKLFSLCDPRPRKYPNIDEIVDLTDGAENMQIVNCWDKMDNFEHTASIIKGMDAIISVDTVIMHLAGALGVPTFGLIAYTPDWRWGIEKQNTQWYNNLTLMRQSKLGDWEDIFKKLKYFIKAIISDWNRGLI